MSSLCNYYISNMFSVIGLNLYWSPCYLCGRNGTLGRVENCCGLCLIVGLNIGLITFAAPLRKFLKKRVTPNPNWASAPGNGWITSDTSTNKIEAASKPMPVAGFELTFLHCIMSKKCPCYKWKAVHHNCTNCLIVNSQLWWILLTNENQNFILIISHVTNGKLQ